MLLNTPALYVPQSFCVHEAQSALMLGHRRQGKAVNNFKPIPHSCPTLQAGQRAIVGLTLLPHIAGRARQAMNDFKPIPHSCPTLQAGQRAINDMSIEERLTRNIPKNVSKVG